MGDHVVQFPGDAGPLLLDREPVQFDIDLTPGTDIQSYVDSLNAALQPIGAFAERTSAGPSGTVIAMDSLAAALTLMLVTADDIAVYHLPVVCALALGGLVIAVAGALLPAGWAARAGTATALRTE